LYIVYRDYNTNVEFACVFFFNLYYQCNACGVAYGMKQGHLLTVSSNIIIKMWLRRGLQQRYTLLLCLYNANIYATVSEILGPIDEMTSLSEMTSKMRHEKWPISYAHNS